MKKIIITAALAATALAGCGSGAAEHDSIRESADKLVESLDLDTRCPALGETMPVELTECSNDGEELTLLADREYPSGCVSVRIGDDLYAKRGDVVVTTDPCE